MPTFRSKTRTITAEQWFPERLLPGVVFDPNYIDRDLPGEQPYYLITIHGQRVYLESGDWVVPEPDGQHYYPVKPDIFADRYEPVEPAVGFQSGQLVLEHRSGEGVEPAVVTVLARRGKRYVVWAGELTNARPHVPLTHLVDADLLEPYTGPISGPAPTVPDARLLTLRFPEMAEEAELDAMDPDEWVQFYFDDPPPGVDWVDAVVVSATADGGDLVAQVEIDPKAWIRFTVQLGEDVYETLAELKKDLPSGEIAALVEWLKSEPDLTVTVISTKSGELQTDQRPIGSDL